MEKNVLLARPHPFIVADMKAFLTRNGYVPNPLSSLDQLSGHKGSIKGAVISTSVTSSVSESTEDVIKAIRTRYAHVPIVLATLIEFDAVVKTMERSITTALPGAKLLPVAAASEAQPALGKDNGLLVIRRGDLIDKTLSSIADRLLLRHFG